MIQISYPIYHSGAPREQLVLILPKCKKNYKVADAENGLTKFN